jgi:hypothetical protein
LSHRLQSIDSGSAANLDDRPPGQICATPPSTKSSAPFMNSHPQRREKRRPSQPPRRRQDGPSGPRWRVAQRACPCDPAPVMKSRTPRAASSCAEARPIPVDAPVMSATFPFSEFLMQADRELHRARQPAFAVVAGLPRPLGASAYDENSCDMCTLPYLRIQSVRRCQQHLV